MLEVTYFFPKVFEFIIFFHRVDIENNPHINVCQESERRISLSKEIKAVTQSNN